MRRALRYRGDGVMARAPTLAQQRARHAWRAVKHARTSLGKDSEDYAREAKRFPVRIMTSGLGQTLAFMDAKGGKGRQQLTTDLADWLLAERKFGDKGEALMKTIIDGDADLLRRATEEAQAYLQWLTRFAEAEIPIEGE